MMMMMMMMMMMSTFLAHDSINVNAQYAEGGCVEDREKIIRIKIKKKTLGAKSSIEQFCCCCCFVFVFRYRL